MNKDKERICLIGMPGSGKSTIGKQLSDKLKYSFFDTDEEIEKKEKTKIKDIFLKKGEEKCWISTMSYRFGSSPKPLTRASTAWKRGKFCRPL